ncbi:hypothetical protein BKA69DRAFT_167776 [Paraphysoderma sedebokerense]|nr:hypothetical protein BKA69DRAFT_167776 [Paraphysoderma sedebokerense]
MIEPYGMHNFTIAVMDVDDALVTLVLVKAPQHGYLSADGATIKEGSQFISTQLFFHSNNSGGGYPYSNFSIYAVDEVGALSDTCTFQFTFTCPPRLYNNIFSGGKGPICSECPTGSFCSHDGKLAPHPNYGWWKNNEVNAFIPCIPPEACPGSELECNIGYEGPRCGKCSNGFYRISGTCKSCKTALPDWVVPIGTIGVFVLICAMSLALKGGPSEGLINILLNFIQTVALFDQLNFDFYPSLKSLIEGFNGIGYLNIELAAPECILSKYQLASALDYRFKFTVTALIPVILLGINKMFVNCVQAYNTLLGMIYIILVNQSIALASRIFDCSMEPDGNYWLDVQPDSLCYRDWWESYASLGYVAVAFYVIGIPLYFSILIFLYYQRRFVGVQWMRAREYAEQMLNVRNSYFRSTHQLFIIVQFTRKVLIVIVKMFLTKYIILQAVLTSVILSIDAVLSAKYLPYVFKSLNALEVICTLSAVIIMNGALLIHTNQFKEVSQRDAVAAIVATLIIACVAVSIIMVVIEIVTRIKRWREARKDSTVFDEKILANTQVGGDISRIRLENTTFLRRVFGLTVGSPMEESSLKAKQSVRRNQ